VKRQVRKVTRVPIDLMAAIQKGDLRGTNVYETDRLGTKAIARVEGHDLSPHDPEKLYSKEQIDKYVKDLVEGRRKFTEEIASEGLQPEIAEAAEESFGIAGRSKVSVAFPSPEPEVEEPARREEKSVRDYFADYEPVRRPRRPSNRRHR
jgi:phosphoenolpyruvate carboxykinase (ATP)